MATRVIKFADKRIRYGPLEPEDLVGLWSDLGPPVSRSIETAVWTEFHGQDFGERLMRYRDALGAAFAGEQPKGSREWDVLLSFACIVLRMLKVSIERGKNSRWSKATTRGLLGRLIDDRSPRLAWLNLLSNAYALTGANLQAHLGSYVGPIPDDAAQTAHLMLQAHMSFQRLATLLAEALKSVESPVGRSSESRPSDPAWDLANPDRTTVRLFAARAKISARELRTRGRTNAEIRALLIGGFQDGLHSLGESGQFLFDVLRCAVTQELGET